MAVTTCEYKMPQSLFVMKLLLLKARMPLVFLAVAFIATVVTGVILDLRFIIVGAMLLFLVLPMLVAFVYISYALSPRCFFNTVSHTVTFADDGITVCWDTTLPSDVPKSEPTVEKKTKFIPISDSLTYTYGLNAVTLFFHGKPFGFLYLPYSVFPTDVDIQATLSGCCRPQ